MDVHIFDTQFIDGTWHAVYETPSGRQYIIYDECKPVFGIWLIPREKGFGTEDLPVTVEPR